MSAQQQRFDTVQPGGLAIKDGRLVDAWDRDAKPNSRYVADPERAVRVAREQVAAP